MAHYMNQLSYLRDLLPNIKEIDPVAAGWIEKYVIKGEEVSNELANSMANIMLHSVLDRLGKLEEFMELRV